MAEKHGMIRWFLSELPRLQADGVITPETADALDAHYSGRLAADSPRNYFLLALSIIGGLLITGGVILLIGHNWDMLGKKLQITVSLLPLLAAGGISVYTLARKKSQGWRECSALFTAGGGAAAVALLSHIYQTGGDFQEFMLLVILFSLPLLYIFNSVSLTVVTVFMLFTQCDSYQGSLESQMISLGLLGALLPMVLYHVSRRDSRYRAVMNYALSFCAGVTLLAVRWENLGAYMLILSCLFLLCGIRRYEQDEGFWRNPWLPGGFAFLTHLLAIQSCDKRFIEPWDLQVPTAILLGAAVAVFAGFFIFDVLKGRLTAGRVLLALTVAMAAVSGFCEDKILYRLMANLLMFAFGVAFLRQGWLQRRLLVFNGGFIMLAMLLIYRFFDSDMGMLLRAGLFIVIGTGFILSNFFLSRRLGREVPHA